MQEYAVKAMTKIIVTGMVTKICGICPFPVDSHVFDVYFTVKAREYAETGTGLEMREGNEW